MIVRLLAAILILSATHALSANKYCRAGASGTGSGNDWTNAYTSLATLETNLARGDVGYVADGSYSGITCNTATSSTTTITIKKATVADHGTSTGWDDTYGDGQATISGSMQFASGYWVFDGATGGGPGSWKTGHGFAVTATSNFPVVYLTAGNITISHVEIEGAGNDGTGGGIGNDCVQFISGSGPLTISHCWLHDAGRVIFYHAAGAIMASHCLTGQYESTGGEHAELAVIRSGELFIFRWGVVTHEEGTGGFICANDTPANGLTTVELYGNIFLNLAEFGTWGGSNNGFIASFTLDAFMRNWKVYNNTFYDFPSDLSAFGQTGESPSGNEARNNLYYSMSDTGVGSGWSQSFDHFVDTGGTDGTNATSASGDPFVSVDVTSSDFGKLSANTTAGTNLGSPYNVDMYGNTRSTWTRGAIEFYEAVEGGSAAIGTLNVQNLTIGQ